MVELVGDPRWPTLPAKLVIDDVEGFDPAQVRANEQSVLEVR